MGITIHELRAVVSGNLVGFSQMVDGAISKTQSLRKAWGDFASDAARATNRIVNTFAVLGGAGAAMSAKLGFSFNSIKEQSEIAFTTFLGDATKAKKFIADLTEFAAKTPFELPGLLDSTKKLMAFGFQAEQIIPMLTVVGDAAAALGNPAAMDFIIRALGQIQAKGKVAAQEMNQLAEQGIPAWEMLAKEIGVSIPEAMKLAEDGAISASVAIPAILSGMDSRFRGMMEKQSNSMSGLFSTLMDRLRGWAGDAFEPLYNSVRNGLSKMLGGESLNTIDGFIQRVRGSMALVAAQVDAIFAQDPAALFASVGEVVDKTAKVFASLVQWLRQASPEFAEAGRRVWEFVGPIFDYLKEHPQILAALIALKVTGFLGINQAVMSLGGALLQTVQTLGSLATIANSSGVAMRGMRLAAIGMGFVALTAYILQTSDAMRSYNEAVKESARLNQKIDQGRERKRDLRLRDISELSDPAAQRDALQAEIVKAKKELEGKENSAAGLAADADTFSKSIKSKNPFGSALLDDMKKQADQAAAEARSAQAYLYRLEDELHNAEKEIEKAVGGGLAEAGGTGSPTGTGGTAGGGTGGSIFDIPADQVAGIAGGDKAKEEAAQRLETATNEVDGFVKRIAGLVDLLPDETLQSFEREFNDIQQDFIEGELDAREYRAELDYLNETIQLSAEAANNATRFEDQLANFRERLSGQGVDLGAAAINGFQSRFNSLNQQFAAGDISARKFAQATDALQREMDAAGNAAIKELQAKERARLLSGNFTQAEFQRAAEDRIIALRMRQFDQAVETAVNGMLGLNQGFENLQNGLDQFGNGLQNFGQGGGYFGDSSFDLNQLSAAQATYTSFLQTTQGRIADLLNSIGLAQNRLSLSSLLYGDVVSGAERWKTVEQIEQWTRELVELQKAPPPQFVQGLGTFEYKDPGLQYGSSGAAGSLTLNFPNLTRMGNQDVQDLVAAINREQQRQGRPLFGN